MKSAFMANKSGRTRRMAAPRLGKKSLPLLGRVALEMALIIIETSSSASPCGMLAPQTAVGDEEDVQCDSTPTYMRRTVASICMPGRCMSVS
jgi:hypothetical protein